MGDEEKDKLLMNIRHDLLTLFNQSRGWDFRVKATPLIDTIEGVDFEKLMVHGRKYGSFHVDLCELIGTQKPKLEN